MLPMILLVLVVLIVLWAAAAYNGLIRMRNQCDEAFATMDVYLKKRFDLIPNLVSTVKGYAKHESETLEKIIAARGANHSGSLDERMKYENSVSGALRQIFALSENYPDLKANTNFLDLQGQLKKVEEDIANSRKYYNAVVKQYNDKCMTVPSNIIASLAHFERQPMFEVESTEERRSVNVEF
ncbi:MAG TPA: hypothetical protein DDX51_05385 [Clostridiales bacterium]|nr:hypothetical protein [Clostridiales bacterium]